MKDVGDRVVFIGLYTKAGLHIEHKTMNVLVLNVLVHL